MSPFAKLMSRFGWIRLCSYGLELSLDGRLVPAGSCTQHSLDSSWDRVPVAGVDLAATFDPALANVPPRQSLLRPPAIPAAARPKLLPLRPLPQAVAAQEPAAQTRSIVQSSVQEEMSEEDEWAWQAAVAKAKADDENRQREPVLAPTADSAGEEDIGFADTAPLDRAQHDAEQTVVAQEVLSFEETQDWDLLMRAARERADERELFECDDTKIQAESKTNVCMPDFAAAQVETCAQAANDDLPATSVTSIHALKLRPLATADQSQADDDEWSTMRKQIDAREREESTRKLRAMREIQRLQGRSPLQDLTRPSLSGSPPLRRRLAAGTSPAPTAFAKGGARPVARFQPSPKASSETSSCDDTRVDLPRATERLSR